MRHYASVLLTAAALASSAFAWAQRTPAAGVNPFAADVNQRSFTVTGTVVSVGSGSLVVKIDDHGHPIPFSLGPSVSPAELGAGSRVSVRYHPTGSTGQVADEVTVIAGQRSRGTRR
jgi:hypothetical protein